MSKGRGGKIKNWNKNGEDFWTYTGGKDMKMAIGQKTRKGYPVSLFGNDTKTQTRYQPTKQKARNYAAKWRRKLK